LRGNQAVQVDASPGRLGNQPATVLGVAVATTVSTGGEAASASAAVVDPRAAEEFFARRDAWTERWGGGEHRNVLTRDGNRVRSRAEALIANWLSEQGIAYDYETPMPYRDSQGRVRHIHPDFFLFDDNVYVEYWGRDDSEYIESRRFKEAVYQQRSIVPVHIEREEVDNLVFQRKIRERIGR
jgi:hypothetical protein